jgi:hypothetical protein
MASIVGVFCGGRGSGKTLSMSTEGLLAMASGLQVFANYSIQRSIEFPDGKVVNYKSIPVEIDDLVTFKPEIRDGLVCLDELNLWCSNRGAMSLVNRLLNSWVQLIRKRNLTLYITTQNFESLDRMVRWQCDVTVECYDQHFLYRNLPEGASISQVITDWSGIFSGRALFKADDWEARLKNMTARTLSARRFWGIYNSWSEVDIIKAMTTYQIDRPNRVIGAVEMPETLKPLVQDLKDSGFTPGTVLSRVDVFRLCRQWGYSGRDRDLDTILCNLGFKQNGEAYEIP